MKDKIYIHIKITNELHDKLIEEASKMGLSLNSYVNLIFFQRQMKK